MKYRQQVIAGAILLLPVVALAIPVAAQEAGETTQIVGQIAGHIAGTSPSERPADAPRITEFKPGAEWLKNALKGVSEPVPESLGFLKDQGAWFTPFNHPGMPGRYDIRGLHGAKGS